VAHLVVLAARLTLGAIWIFAALAKLTNRHANGEAVDEVGLIRGRAARAIGVVLPYLELALGLLLVTGEELLAASLTSGVLPSAFSLAISVNLIKGRQVKCNCFGQYGGEYITWRTLVRNICLILLAGIPVLLHSDYVAVHRLLALRPVAIGEPSIAEPR